MSYATNLAYLYLNCYHNFLNDESNFPTGDIPSVIYLQLGGYNEHDCLMNNLDILKHFSGLRELDFNYNGALLDMTEIKNCYKLNKITLNNCNITKVSGIKNFAENQYSYNSSIPESNQSWCSTLKLNGNKLTDIYELKYFIYTNNENSITHLSTLDLRNNTGLENFFSHDETRYSAVTDVLLPLYQAGCHDIKLSGTALYKDDNALAPLVAAGWTKQ